MVEFTDDAREYLEGYLRQVSALARRNGDDVDEIVGGLRGHVEEMAGAGGVGVVDQELLMEVLDAVGSPEEVMGVDGGSEWKFRVVPEMVPGGRKEEVIPPQVIVQQQRSGWWKVAMVLVLLIVVPFVFLIGLVIIANITAIAIPNHKRAAESELRAECANNLKQIGMGLRRYARANDGVYPSIAHNFDHISFDLYDLWPEYVEELHPFVCPAVTKITDLDVEVLDGEAFLSPDVRELIWTDESYIYLEATMPSIELWGEYVRSLGEMKAEGQFGGAKPDVGLDLLHEVSEEDAGRVPVMIERPGRHFMGLEGGHVLYLDGRVVFLKMGAKYPMVPEFFELLEEID